MCPKGTASPPLVPFNKFVDFSESIWILSIFFTTLKKIGILKDEWNQKFRMRSGKILHHTQEFSAFLSKKILLNCNKVLKIFECTKKNQSIDSMWRKKIAGSSCICADSSQKSLEWHHRKFCRKKYNIK